LFSAVAATRIRFGTVTRYSALLGGAAAAMVFALIVGFLTTSFYVIALRVLRRRNTIARG